MILDLEATSAYSLSSGAFLSYFTKEYKDYALNMHPNLTKSYAKLRNKIKPIHLVPSIVDKVVEQQLASNLDYTTLSKAWENQCVVPKMNTSKYTRSNYSIW